MSIRNGATYVIVNAKSGTAMDLSGTNNRDVIGWEKHGGPNQQWKLEENNNQWIFRNQGESEKYLALGEGGLRDATPLEGAEDPVPWDIWPDEEIGGAFRIFVPGAPRPLNVDLSDHGNRDNGTPVTLWGKWEGRNQVWYFEEV